jgi:hypothetical protein
MARLDRAIELLTVGGDWLARSSRAMTGRGFVSTKSKPTKTKRTKTKHLAPMPRWVYHADDRTCSTTPAREIYMLTPGSGFLELEWVRQ